ncbi:MAG: hypothetical protein AAF721_30230, partial [Myxococcota bacterium]
MAAALAGLSFVVFAIAMVCWPRATATLAAKEGPLEHVSHAVLALAVAAAAFRAATGGERGAGGRWPHVGVTLWLFVVLGEELDWGRVYGVDALATPLASLVGRPDLHNAWSGASYLLFAIPVVWLAWRGW